MCLEVLSSLIDGIEPITFENGQLVEASLLDGNQCLLNHLLHYVWQRGNDSDDVVFLKAVDKFFNRVAWVPLCTSLALVQFLLNRIGGTVKQVCNLPMMV